MNRKRLMACYVAVLLIGCGKDASNEHATDTDRSFAGQAVETVDQPADHASGGEPSTAARLVKPYFPRPIKTEDEAEACLAAAKELDDRIERITGVPSRDVTKRLSDCVARYDAHKTGYTKFYPGRTRVRFNLRDPDIADVNVFAPEHETAVLHVRIDATSMMISCTDISGGQEANVTLMRSSDSEPFSRFGPWDQIENADELERYCTQLYDDFFKLRGP